jgi:hypothetical protein
MSLSREMHLEVERVAMRKILKDLASEKEKFKLCKKKLKSQLSLCNTSLVHILKL